MDSKLNSDILNILIEEELLNQHSEKIGGTISNKELDEAIATLEQRNKMPENGLSSYLMERGLSMNSFRQQIKGELIKTNIVNSLFRSVTVSQTEIDAALINSPDQDFNVEAWVFTSKEGADNSLKQMQTLKKRLVSCNKLDDKLYANFADAEKFDRKLKEMPSRTQSIMSDTKVNSSSSIYKEDDKFKLVFVCKKDRTVSADHLAKFETFLSNKKMSQKARKFFNDLRAKAYIKIMI
jgi:parvulin-like peptidyl-prolyl isomerase